MTELDQLDLAMSNAERLLDGRHHHGARQCVAWIEMHYPEAAPKAGADRWRSIKRRLKLHAR